MKKIHYLAILILILTLSECNSKSKSEGDISLSASLVSKFTGENSTKINYLVRIEIVNNTVCKKSFWIMSCGYMDFFIVNRNNVEIYRHDCDRNFPKQVDINGKEHKVVLCTLYHSKNIIIKEKMRIGFIIIGSDEFSYFSYLNFEEIFLKKYRERKDVVWSNEFDLN